MQLPSQFDRYAENPNGIKAGAETGSSLLVNAFFDLLNQGETAAKNLPSWAKSFINDEEAAKYAAYEEAMRTRYPDVEVSEDTKEIQSAVIDPIVDAIAPLVNTWAARNPNAAETISDFAQDPSNRHLGANSILAAPIFGRLGRQLLDADFGENLRQTSRRASGTGGKEKGFIIPAEEAIKRSDAAGKTDLSTKLAVNHQVALQMLADKESPGDIAKKTEFHPIPNKHGTYDLVWEVPGTTMPKNIPRRDTGTNQFTKDNWKLDRFSDYYANPLLFELVPELKNTKVIYEPNYNVGEGWMDQGTNTMHIGTDNLLASGDIKGLTQDDIMEAFQVGIHELAHKGQGVFDMAKGGAPDLFRSGKHTSPIDLMNPVPTDPYQQVTDALLKGENWTDINARINLPDRGREALMRVGANQTQLRNEPQFGMFPEDKFADRQFAKDFRNRTSTAHQKYNQLAGEASANADMKRNLWTDEKRLEIPYAESMAKEGGVINPQMLRFRDQDGSMPITDASKEKITDAMMVPKGQRGAINLLSGDGIVQPYGTNSTRIPTEAQQFKQGIDAHRRGDLLVSSALLSPEKREQLADIYRTYPALQNIDPFDTEAALEESIDFMAGNLDDILTIMPDKWRDESMEWYRGYNRIANDAAKQHNTTPEQAGSIIAVLSPQTDWNVNLTRADRIMDTWNTRQDFAWSPEMEAQMPNLRESINEAKYADKLDNIRGKKLSELDSSEEKAMWIRAYDQAHNSRDFHLYKPTGERGEIALKKGGDARQANWASTSVIDKAVKILEDGSPENISRQLGGEHKVRSFNRNAADPDEMTTTTMDTHAVATALMQPLGSSVSKDLTMPRYDEVAQNFGMGMTDATTGMRGTYPINQDAYNVVARRHGIPGRQVQSPTWEYGRAMMEGQKTEAQKRYADHIWRGYADGKLSRREAFDLIVKSFGEPTQP